MPANFKPTSDEARFFRERWRVEEPFKAAYAKYEALMNGINQHGESSGIMWFNELLALLPKTSEGLTDCRGFLGMPSTAFRALDVADKKIVDVDFSFSELCCHTFVETQIENCRFIQARLQDLTFRHCVFQNCRFMNTEHETCNAGVHTTYRACVFENSRMPIFGFGLHCQFEKTVFKGLESDRWGTGGTDVIFNECTICGHVYRIWLVERVQTLDAGLLRNLFWPKKRIMAPRFVKCDLSGLRVESGFISKRAEFVESSLPSGNRNVEATGYVFR